MAKASCIGSSLISALKGGVNNPSTSKLFYNPVHMKKICLFVVILALPLAIVAQKKGEEKIQAPKMPADAETKLITYTHVIETQGTAADLYKRGMKWFNTNYKNPTDVIRETEDGKKILGKARFTIYSNDAKTGTQLNDGVVMYDITLQFKEGKCKYEITKINWKKPSYYGIEKWVDENNKTYNAVLASYLVQTDEYFQDLISKLKKAITTPETKKSDDW